VTGRVPSFLKRTLVIALVTLFVWAALSIALPLAEARPDATLLGLPLRAALALPIALPAFVLTMLWFAARQNLEDERFRDDD
jgi:putative solute:sodium symporter small subunit